MDGKIGAISRAALAAGTPLALGDIDFTRATPEKGILDSRSSTLDAIRFADCVIVVVDATEPFEAWLGRVETELRALAPV